MTDKELVKEIAVLQTLSMRYVERNTTLKCYRHRDFDNIIMAGKTRCTYEKAAENLQQIIMEYCSKSRVLVNRADNLFQQVKESGIAKLKFGLVPAYLELPGEYELGNVLILEQLRMERGMEDIAFVSKTLGIKEDTIKKAVQEERLLNTKKVGKTWIVHIPECREYWKKEEEK